MLYTLPVLDRMATECPSVPVLLSMEFWLQMDLVSTREQPSTCKYLVYTEALHAARHVTDVHEQLPCGSNTYKPSLLRCVTLL